MFSLGLLETEHLQDAPEKSSFESAVEGNQQMENGRNVIPFQLAFGTLELTYYLLD